MQRNKFPVMEKRGYHYLELKKICLDNFLTDPFHSACLWGAVMCLQAEINFFCEGDIMRAIFYSKTLTWADLTLYRFNKSLPLEAHVFMSEIAFDEFIRRSPTTAAKTDMQRMKNEFIDALIKALHEAL